VVNVNGLIVGQIVGIDHPKYPGRYKITKVNPKKVIVYPEPASSTGHPSGSVRGVNVAKAMIIDPPAEGAAFTSHYERTAESRPANLRVGAIVTLREGVWKNKADDLFVVFADKYDRVNVVPLGGHPDNRYLRATPGMITAVMDPSQIGVVPF
jgi:hypothetical protein